MNLAAIALVLLVAGCASEPRSRTGSDDYLRYVGFELPFNENVLLHWSRRQMPLRVHVPCSTRWAMRSASLATAPTTRT